MRRVTGIASFILLLSAPLLLSGCGKNIKWFRGNEPKGQQVRVKDSDLKQDVFYVKDGTDFIATGKLKGSGANGTPNGTDSDGTRILYEVGEYDNIIPTLYADEILAEASTSADWTGVLLERYKFMGYSIGVYNAVYSKDGNDLSFDLDGNVIEGTDLYDQLSKMESRDFRITGIDGRELDDANTNRIGGFLPNLEKDSVHTIDLYSGTYFHRIQVKADTEMFQSFEVYSYGKDLISDTPNGYRSFRMPAGMYSGYYAVNGSGIFRFAAFEKGKGSIDEENYNLEFYSSRQTRLADTTTQYSFTVDSASKNLSLYAVYDVRTLDDGEVPTGYVFAPDGTQYEMDLDPDHSKLSLDMTSAMAGKWTVNIAPKTMKITEIRVADNTKARELTQENYELTLTEARDGIAVRADIENLVANAEDDDINVTGNVVMPDGSTVVMELKWNESPDGSKSWYLFAPITYAPEGDYSVTISHYPEQTKIGQPQVVNNRKDDVETIIVDG